jgi:hypothetical protein
MTNIVVPSLGESVSTATVARWLKKAGEVVTADEPLVELETDKVTVEVNAPVAVGQHSGRCCRWCREARSRASPCGQACRGACARAGCRFRPCAHAGGCQDDG